MDPSQVHLLSSKIWVLFDTPVSRLCRSTMPRVVAAWLRCYVMVNVVYFLTGGMWAYYVYLCWGHKFFSTGNMPAGKDMWEQIKVRWHYLLAWYTHKHLWDITSTSCSVRSSCAQQWQALQVITESIHGAV